MEILHTFVKGLYVFIYDEESVDELERLFDEWIDVEFLQKFFMTNIHDLEYFHLDINNAVSQTIIEARGLSIVHLIIKTKKS